MANIKKQPIIQTCKKSIKTIIFISLFSAGVTLFDISLKVFNSAQALYAEEGKQQLHLENTFQGNQNKYDRKIRSYLNLQKDFGNPNLAQKTFDSLCNKITKKVKSRSRYTKREAIKVLRLIGNILEEEGNFKYKKNNLLIEGLMNQKNGKRFIDCDDYSSFFLVAGEQLGLSLIPVYIPRHVFLQCRLNDREHFYWEPTLGEEKDMAYYKALVNFTERNDYPIILGEKAFDAIQFCNLGVAWYEKGEFSRSIEYLEEAVRLNPHYAAAYNNLGVSCAKQGKFEKAIRHYKRAISINSSYAAALNNMGIAFYKLGFQEKALASFEKAIHTDPRYERAYYCKAVVLKKRGEHKKAARFLKIFRKLNTISKNHPRH